MDYPCAKFGDFSFSRFGFVVRTHRQTESQRRINAILTRVTTTVGVSSYIAMPYKGLAAYAMHKVGDSLRDTESGSRTTSRQMNINYYANNWPASVSVLVTSRPM